MNLNTKWELKDDGSPSLVWKKKNTVLTCGWWHICGWWYRQNDAEMSSRHVNTNAGMALEPGVVLDSSCKYYCCPARKTVTKPDSILSLLYLWPALSVLLNTTFPWASLHPHGVYWALRLRPSLLNVYTCLSVPRGVRGGCWPPLFRAE